MRKSPINTRAGKRKFIRDLCNVIRDGMLGKVPSMPAEWDGCELRQYLIDTAELLAGRIDPSSNRKRLVDYRNTVITQNL